MLKYSLTFAAGMVVTAAIAYKGQASAGAWFLAGLLAQFIVSAALLSKISRVDRLARFLKAFEAAWSDKASTAAKASKPAETAPAPPDDDDEQLISALVNMGAPKKRAKAAAAQVLQNAAGAPFQEQFRQAVNLVRN